MPKNLFFLAMSCALLISTSSLATARLDAASLVTFDRGSKTSKRVYISAQSCHAKPCLISRNGAIRFSKEAQNRYTIEAYLVHRDQVTPISFFQAASALDDKLDERLFNRRQNRRIFNLEESLNTGKIDTIYIYGVYLHYLIEEADLIAISLKQVRNPKKQKHYYFRHHRKGPVWDIDVGLVTPIKFFNPNPGGVVRGATAAPAFSMSIGWYADPEKRLGFMRKFLYAWKFNLVGGVLVRRELVNRTTDQFVDTRFDGFVGSGITLLDFVTIGYGVNLVRSPHSTFPFLGIEVKNAYHFVRSLRQSTNKKWRVYLKAQEQREALSP